MMKVEVIQTFYLDGHRRIDIGENELTDEEVAHARKHGYLKAEKKPEKKQKTVTLNKAIEPEYDK